MVDEAFVDFIEQVGGDGQLRVEENLGGGFVRLRSAEAERRQAKHDIRCVEDIVIEMLRNARDAQAKAVFLASGRDGDTRSLTILDDGVGIPADLHSLIFEPRVTSKLETMVMDDWGVHGRGMALFSIQSNTSEARVITSAPGLGTSIRITVDTSLLPEKNDQSTFPQVEKDEDGVLHVVKGPHNILRCALEFALVHRKGMTVYVGSPSEIAATMMEYGKRNLSREKLLFCDDISTLPVCECLAAAADAGEFVSVCSTLGLDISERTAHRILSGQIGPVKHMVERVIPTRAQSSPAAIDLLKDSRGLKLSKDDAESFSRALEKAFEPLARQYYLSLKDLPKISVKGDTITVRYYIDKEF
jgi:hypothetical protein